MLRKISKASAGHSESGEAVEAITAEKTHKALIAGPPVTLSTLYGPRITELGVSPGYDSKINRKPTKQTKQSMLKYLIYLFGVDHT